MYGNQIVVQTCLASKSMSMQQRKAITITAGVAGLEAVAKYAGVAAAASEVAGERLLSPSTACTKQLAKDSSALMFCSAVSAMRRSYHGRGDWQMQQGSSSWNSTSSTTNSFKATNLTITCSV